MSTAFRPSAHRCPACRQKTLRWEMHRGFQAGFQKQRVDCRCGYTGTKAEVSLHNRPPAPIRPIRHGQPIDDIAIVRLARLLYVPRVLGCQAISNLLSPLVGRELPEGTVRQWCSGETRRDA